ARYRERASDPLELVLAGSAAAEHDGVRVVRSPDRDQLAALYAGAAALVHPSLYEGFGMTALEAMTVGVPVLAARSPGVLEVCGDAARYADPSEAESFADAMLELAAGGELTRRLAAAGRERAAHFSWADCALRHLDAYSLAVRA
ncbi:MAG: glycosyltransferase, partial [Acidimicrobiia bacterium]|nr:glycosyltransferase [Acidimicrobiia bacterium]